LARYAKRQSFSIVFSFGAKISVKRGIQKGCWIQVTAGLMRILWSAVIYWDLVSRGVNWKMWSKACWN